MDSSSAIPLLGKVEVGEQRRLTQPLLSQPPSALQDLVECLHYRVLLCLDESALSGLGACSLFFGDIVNESALWKRLAMRRNRLAPSRFLGVMSNEAAEVVSVEDPKPHLLVPGTHAFSLQRVQSTASPSDVDWRDVCHQLNIRMAERPWGADDRADGSSAAIWTELTSGWEMQDRDRLGYEDADARLPAGGIYAAQSPHLFWVGGNRLLALSGCYCPDMLGGAAVQPLRDVYILDLNDAEEDRQAAPARQTRTGLSRIMRCLRPSRQTRANYGGGAGLHATRLDCGTADGRLPNGHPSLNGAASDFDPIRRTAFFFGGGSPHGTITNAVSALRLDGWEVVGEGTPSCRWEVVETPGSVEAGQVPSARQGVKGVVFEDEFIIFGGRMLGGECLDDVWSLDLADSSTQTGACASHQLPSGLHKLPNAAARHVWRQLMCDGRGPSPRVWFGACHAVHGRWFIYGGSTWNFEEPAEPNDYRVLYILDLAERRWSSVDPSPGPVPPPVVASALIPLGSCQLLLLGGTLPHRVGRDGLNADSLREWREWYSRLDMPHVFDLETGTWTQRSASVMPSDDRLTLEEHITELYLRGHLAAVFVPHRRSVVAFGGSRYFTGEYFNDVLELRLPHGQPSGQRSRILGEGRPIEERMRVQQHLVAPDNLPKHLRRHQHGERLLTQGFLGRVRAMTRDGLMPREEFDAIVEDF